MLAGTYAIAGESTTLNISHLPAGTYIVKVGSKAAKVVKQ
ncbi:MAG: T9SS type A sorting domain-containing protein [Prevotellaceae bacterium]|nr:T9SS type A sorting domain-containing protein [Prevotellaceae bacterium]